MIQGKEALIGLDKDHYVVKTVPEIPKERNLMSDSITIKLEGNQIVGKGMSALTGYAKVFGGYELDRAEKDDVKRYVTRLIGKGSNKFYLDAHPYPRRWQALFVLSLSLFVVTVGNTILNVALPTIREDLGAGSSQMQWIVDAYLLVFAGLLLTAGSLGDRFGRRRALTLGLIVFATGSALAALSSSATALIASRALMGLGAAGIMPTTLSILTNIFPPVNDPKAIAIWAARVRARIAARTDHGRLAAGALRVEQRLPGQPPDRRAVPARRSDDRARVA